MDKRKLFTKILAGILLGLMVLSVCGTTIFAIVRTMAK